MRKLLDRGISNALYMQIAYTEGGKPTIEQWFNWKIWRKTHGRKKKSVIYRWNE